MRHNRPATIGEYVDNPALGSLVYYLASHEIDAERRSLFFSFLDNPAIIWVTRPK